MNPKACLPLLLLAVLAAPALLTGCRQNPPAPSAPASVAGLQLAAARSAQLPSTSPMVGSVRARESASLAAQVFGRVTSVLVHEGDQVRAGQLLVRLDSAEAQANLQQSQSAVQAAEHNLEAARAQAALAASTLERYKILRDQKSISPQEFDEVARRSEASAAQFAAAQAQLAAQKAQASAVGTVAGYSTIAAPFAGVVTGRHVDPGAMAAPGVPLIDLDRSGPMQLVVSVDESLLSHLRPGSALRVSIPAASADPIAARVAQIVPAASEASHSFLVKIDLPASPRLMAGMYGAVALDASTRSAVLVPRGAIVTHGSIRGVWVVDARGIASMRYLSLGSEIGPDVEVLSGLSTSEQVVLSPGDRELAGSRIEARQ